MYYFRLMVMMFFIAAFFHSAKAQSSDNVKYVFLFDISGSTYSIDKRHHLDSLMAQAINANVTAGKIREGNSFELIFFGGDATAHIESFDLSALSNLTNYNIAQRRLLDTYKTKAGTRRFQKFSNLHTALDAVRTAVEQASGIFIFTDGKMLKGDFSLPGVTEVSDYVAILREKIAGLKEAGKPVFLVQVSQLLENPYFDVPALPVNSKDSIFLGEDFFWVQRTLKNRSNIKRPFEKFLAEAHERIIKSHQTAPLEKGEPIGTMVYVDRAKRLGEAIASHRVTIPLTSRQSGVLSEIATIQSLISGSVITVAQAIEFSREIDRLASSPDGLEVVVKELEVTTMSNRINPWASGTLKKIQQATLKTDLSIVKDRQGRSADLEEAIVQGLADYIIKRTQQEAILFLLDELESKTRLTSSYVRDTLFYHSFQSLKQLEGDRTVDLLLIKESFNEDMDELPVNLIKHPKLKQSEALVGLIYSYQLARNIMLSGDLEKSFAMLPDLKRKIETLGPANSVLERGILLNAFLIGALKKFDLSKPLSVESQEFRNLCIELIAYFGGKYPDFNIIDITNVQTNVAAIYQRYLNIQAQLNELTRLAQQLPETNYFEYQQYKREILKDILQQSSELLISGIELTTHFQRDGDTPEKLSRQARMITDEAQRAVNAWFLIEDKQYTKAVMLLLPLIENVVHTSPDLHGYFREPLSSLAAKMKEDELRQQVVAFKSETKEVHKQLVELNTAGTLTTILVDINGLPSEDAIRRELAKHKLTVLECFIESGRIDPAKVARAIDFLNYAIGIMNSDTKTKKLKGLKLDYEIPSEFAFKFMNFPELNENFRMMLTVAADVSTAKEAADITNVLTKYALPPASYRTKREKKFSIMLNAYAGVGGGYFHRTDTASIVLSAPIGIEFSTRGLNRKGSFSLLVTPIDIGNVINYQLVGDKSVEDKSIFRFSNIYSPGVFLVFGLSKRHPFSFGIGHQWNDDRFSAFIAFDLPMFRIR